MAAVAMAAATRHRGHCCRGLTSLPFPDEGPPPKPELKATVSGTVIAQEAGCTGGCSGKAVAVKGRSADAQGTDH